MARMGILNIGHLADMPNQHQAAIARPFVTGDCVGAQIFRVN